MQRIALVTGASRGIGAAIADQLAKDGIITVGTATNQQGADSISERFAASGVDGKGVVLDVCSPDSIQQCLSAVTASYASPTILINNAGITNDTLLLRMKDDLWDQVIQTNLTSVYRMSKAVAKGMIKSRWGRIINLSSVVASMGNAGQINYAASKAGVEGLTRSLAKELGSRDITVNAIAPGFVETDMTHELPEAQKQSLLSAVPLRRLGKVEEIAGLVRYLVSEPAAYITGETIHINGGLYMA